MTRSVLPPAGQLFLLCAGPNGNPAEIGALLDSGVDWGELCLLAQSELAATPLWRRLHQVGGDRIPADVGARLRGLARIAHFKMLYLEQRTRETTAALDAAGIECVLLKGAALASTVYDSFAERGMIDIDLLVAPEQAEAALAVVLAAGWIPQGGEVRRRPLDHFHHLPALIDGRGMQMSLEVHTSPLPLGHPFGLTTETMVREAVPAPGGPPGVRVPNPIHLLLHASIHFAWSHLLRRHAWRAIRDVQAIMTRADLDWDTFVHAAKATRARTCCYWTLRLARTLADVPVPQQVLAALRPPRPELVLGALERHFTLILLPTGFNCPSVRLRRTMWEAGILPAWSGHGAVRPWSMLTLDREASLRRGTAELTTRPAPTFSARADWTRYARRVMLGAPPAAGAAV